MDTILQRFEQDRRYQYAALAAIVLLALALRLYRLGDWSFWGDEVITVRRARTVLETALFRRTLTYYLTYGSFQLFGIDEWSARLPAVLAGVALVPLLYLLVRRLFDGTTAVLAALLLAIAPWHLYWSQNARFYTPLLLLYTAGLFAFYLGIEQDRRGLMLVSVACFGLATIERMFALFFLPVVVAYLLLLYWGPWERPAGLNRRNLLLFFGLGLLGALAVALPILLNPELWLGVFAYVNNNPFWLLAGVIYYIGLATMVLGAAAAVFLLRRGSRAGLLLALNSVVPLIGLLVISLFQFSANRYVFVTLPSWIVLAAVAGRELLRHARGEGRWLAAGALALLLISPLSEDFLYFRYQNGNREDFRAALQYAAAQRQPDELLIVPNKELADFYLPGETTGMDQVDPASLAASPRPVWLIEDMNVVDKWPALHAWLHQEAGLVAVFDVHVQARNFRMRVYRAPPQ